MRPSICLLAAALAGCATTPAPADESAKVSRVLAVFAHPDDEIVVAPAIAGALRGGAPHTIVYATSGDQGPGVSGMARGGELARVREGEARCAASALGTDDVRFLGHGDGTLTDRPQDAESPARKLAGELETILREGDYDTVITWGPDGGYGHGDHRIVSAIVTQVVQTMGERRPVLLYPGIRTGTLPPVPQMQAWAVTDPVLLSVALAYDRNDLDRVRAAAQCHATQFSAEERSALPDLFDQTVWQGAVHFRPAFAEAAPAGEQP